MKRRTVLIGGGALALAGIGTLAMRPEERGAMHDPYFNGLAAALKRAGLNRPTLVIDRTEAMTVVATQAVWIVVIGIAGRMLLAAGRRRLEVQGG